MTQVRLGAVSTQVLSGAWAVNGGASSAHAAVSDDLDSTFVRATSGSIAPQIVFRTPAPVLPAGAVTKSVGIYPRYKINKVVENSSDLHWWAYRLRSSLNPDANYATTTIYIRGDDPFFVYGVPASPTPPVFAAAIPENERGLLEVLISRIIDQSTDPALSFDAIDLDVWLTYATVPTTTAQAPSGTYTQTSRPAAQWTHTAGSDGSEQTHYEVAWFSSAQFGIVGFDPATSPAFERKAGGGSINSLQPTDSLTNGTWRMYVRTAQTVNGQAHWAAAWSYTEFIVNVTPPTVDEVLVTGWDDTASILVEVRRDTTGPAWEFVDIERLDAETGEWVPVRGGYNAVPVSATALSLVDYETGNGALTRYRARAGRATVEGTVVSQWVNATEDVAWTSDLTWIKDPYDPDKNMTLRVVQFPDDTRPRRQGLHQPLNAELPVSITGKRSTKRGTITFLTETETEREQLDDLSEQAVLLIQAPPGRGWGSRYVVIGDTLAARSSRIAQNEVRRWPTPFVEVASPADVFTVVVGTGSAGVTGASSANPSTSPSTSGPTVSALLVPSDGVWLGAAAMSIDGTFNYTVGLQEYEAVSGGWATAIQHKYLVGADTFFSTADRNRLERSGQPRSMMLYNWKVSGGTHAEIAAGAQDARIITAAGQMKAYPHKFFLGIHHEPDNDTQSTGNTDADYVDMYRHVVDVLRAQGVTNMVLVWTVTSYSGNRSRWAGLYPGDDYTDWIGVNPYGHAYATSLDLFFNERQQGGSGWYDYFTGLAPGKPIMLSEWGFGGDCAQANALLAAMPAALESTYTAVKALVFWHDCNRENNEVKRLTWSSGTIPTSGTFTVTFDGSTSGAISRTASAATVQSTLRAMASIGSPNVICTGGPLPTAIDIEFRGYLRGQNVPIMTCNNGGLSGGTATMTSSTTDQGDDMGSKVYYPQIDPYDATRPTTFDDAWATFAQDELFHRTPTSAAP